LVTKSPQELKSWVKVEPEIDLMSVSSAGNRLIINGMTQAGTFYIVTATTLVEDVWGQRLADTAMFHFPVEETNILALESLVKKPFVRYIV
jgi:hypothetical protein